MVRTFEFEAVTHNKRSVGDVRMKSSLQEFPGFLIAPLVVLRSTCTVGKTFYGPSKYTNQKVSLVAFA